MVYIFRISLIFIFSVVTSYSLEITGRHKQLTPSLLIQKPEDIKQIRRQLLEKKKALNQPLTKYIPESRKIIYKPGSSSSIWLVKGFTTTLQFRDVYDKPLKIKFISTGSSDFHIKTIDESTLSIVASNRYSRSNINIGLVGKDQPVVLLVNEDSDRMNFDSSVTIKYLDKLKRGNSELEYRAVLLDYLIETGDFSSFTPLDYDIDLIKGRKFLLDREQDVEIYKADDEKDSSFFIVKLNSRKFKIVNERPVLEKYRGSFSLYILPMSKPLFIIKSKDRRFKERYRVLIKEW